MKIKTNLHWISLSFTFLVMIECVLCTSSFVKWHLKHPRSILIRFDTQPSVSCHNLIKIELGCSNTIWQNRAVHKTHIQSYSNVNFTVHKYHSCTVLRPMCFRLNGESPKVNIEKLICNFYHKISLVKALWSDEIKDCNKIYHLRLVDTKYVMIFNYLLSKRRIWLWTKPPKFEDESNRKLSKNQNKA